MNRRGQGDTFSSMAWLQLASRGGVLVFFFSFKPPFRFVSFYPNGVSSCLTMNNAWRIMDQKENAATMKEPV